MQQSAPAHAGLDGLAAWLPRRLLLAIDLMTDVALNGTGEALGASELGERQGLPARKLEAVLQRLSRAGLLKGTRGPHGGYVLAAERSRITVGDIARAVLASELPVALEGSPSPTMRRVVLPLVDRFHHALLQEMTRVTLADLCRAARLAGLRGKNDGVIDFVI